MRKRAQDRAAKVHGSARLSSLCLPTGHSISSVWVSRLLECRRPRSLRLSPNPCAPQGGGKALLGLLAPLKPSLGDQGSRGIGEFPCARVPRRGCPLLPRRERGAR